MEKDSVRTPFKPQKEIEDLFLEAMDLLSKKLPNELLYSCLDEIIKYSQEKIVSTVIALAKQDLENCVLIGSLLFEMKHFPTLPAQILKTLTDKKITQNEISCLLFLYKQLFLCGYILPTSFEGLLKQLQMTEQQFQNNLQLQIFTNEHILGILNELSDNMANGNAQKNINKNQAKNDCKSITQIIHELPEFTSKDAFDKSGAFYIDKSVPIPVMQIFHQLDEIDPLLHSTSQDALKIRKKITQFIQPIDHFSPYFKPPLRNEVKKIEDEYYQGQYSGLLLQASKIEKQDPTNPLAYYLKSKIIEALSDVNDSTEIYRSRKEIIALLLKSLNLAHDQKSLHFDIYWDLALTLEMLGYFKSSYLLTLKLLHIAPFAQSNYMTAAFCACQLLRPYKNYIFQAYVIDPSRTRNFLHEYWFAARFKLNDNFRGENPSDEELSRLEKETREVSDFVLNSPTFYRPTPDVLGPDFPINEIFSWDSQEMIPASHPHKKASNRKKDINPNDTIQINPKLKKNTDKALQMVMNNYEPLLEKWSKYLASKKVPKYAQAYQFDIPGDLIYNFYNISKKMPEEWEISEFEDIYQTCVNTQNNTKSYIKAFQRIIPLFLAFLIENMKLDHLKPILEACIEWNQMNKI